MFANLNAAVRNKDLNRAAIASNAVLRHYNVYTHMPKVYGPVKRIQYALKLQQHLKNPIFNKLPGNVKWNIIKR